MINVEKAQIDFIRNDNLESAKVYIEALEEQCRALIKICAESMRVDDAFVAAVLDAEKPKH